MKAITLNVKSVEYITISAQHATEMFDKKINLYLEKGWRKHQDQPENKGTGFKVNLYKPGHELKLATALGENVNEYDDFVHAILKERYPEFEPVLAKSEHPNLLETVIMKKSEPKTFEKPDTIQNDFNSDDQHQSEPPHTEPTKPKYIYFEDGDPTEVIDWANENSKEGYKLMGGIEPKLFIGEEGEPNIFVYHATMELI